MEDILLAGSGMLEIMLTKTVQDYENGEYSWEEFKDPFTAGLTPPRVAMLKIACEELTDSRKDYHIVMSFIEKIEAYCEQYAKEVHDEFENHPIVLKED